ncbi:MAG: acyl-CoA thioesterase/bile acid-CoA:amino acid N-acyltransferase family protein [Bacteroidota bacterium]
MKHAFRTDESFSGTYFVPYMNDPSFFLLNLLNFSAMKLSHIHFYFLFLSSILSHTCLAQTASLEISGQTQFVSDTCSIRVKGLAPNQVATISARILDQRNRPWLSSASFKANKEGLIDLTTQAPFEGSYTGVDPMGLFWSASYRGLSPDSTNAVFSRRALFTYATQIYLEVDGQVLDSLRFARKFLGEDVRRDSVANGDLKAIYYQPQKPKVKGALIVLAGSDGGITSADWRAALLASHGIPALALAFFDYEGLPEDLIELPLEYLDQAVKFLKGKNHERIGILGFSKGSEFTLAYASKMSHDLAAVVAISPSTYVWQGINRNVDVKSSWTKDGQALDFVKWQYNQEVIGMLRSSGPKRFSLLYTHSLQATDSLSLKKAELNLDKARCPSLLIAGTDDGSWPADVMVERLYQQKKSIRPDAPIEKMIFPDAGHLIYFDFLPATDSRRQGPQIFGGNISANAYARRKAWPRILTFLYEHLN